MEHNSSSEEEPKISSNRIACAPCRAIKVKCDRKDPCSRCLAKKIECVYATRRKPGPTQGRATELRQIIKKLRTELGEQKQRNEALERKFQNMSNSMEDGIKQHRDMKLSGHMTNMNTLNTYITVYFDKGFAFLQVRPPFQNLNDYYKKQDMRSPLMNSIFGVGALISGNQAHANMFISKIESSMQSLFDETSPYICARNFVLSGYYASSGDEERDQAYNHRALVMADILKKKSTSAKEVVDINVIQRYSTVKQALHAHNLSLLETIVNDLNNDSDDQYCSFAVAHIENHVLVSSIQAINSMNIDFVLPNNIRKMLTLLSFAERLVLKLQSPMQQMLLMRLSAAKVLVYMIALQDDIAHEVSQQMLTLVSNPVEILIDHPYFTLAPLLIVGQYYMLFGTFTKEFQQLLQLLPKVDSAGLVQGLLLATTKVSAANNMVSWCYFYPQLTIYREKSAEVLQSLYSARDGFVTPQVPRVVEYEDDNAKGESGSYPDDEVHEAGVNNSEALQLELNLDSFLFTVDDSGKTGTT